MATKTKPQTDLQRQVASVKKQVQAKKTELADFEEAIRLTTEKPRWTPKKGELTAFDRLTEILDSKAKPEQAEALAAARESLATGQKELAALEASLEGLTAQQAQVEAIAILEPLGAAVNAVAQAYLTAREKFYLELQQHPSITQRRADGIRLEWVRKPSSPGGGYKPSFEGLHYESRPQEAI